MVMWWERVAKVHIKKLFICEGDCEETRGNTDGKRLLRLSLWRTAANDPTRGKEDSD